MWLRHGALVHPGSRERSHRRRRCGKRGIAHRVEVLPPRDVLEADVANPARQGTCLDLRARRRESGSRGRRDRRALGWAGTVGGPRCRAGFGVGRGIGVSQRGAPRGSRCISPGCANTCRGLERPGTRARFHWPAEPRRLVVLRRIRSARRLRSQPGPSTRERDAHGGGAPSRGRTHLRTTRRARPIGWALPVIVRGPHPRSRDRPDRRAGEQHDGAGSCRLRGNSDAGNRTRHSTRFDLGLADGAGHPSAGGVQVGRRQGAGGHARGAALGRLESLRGGDVRPRIQRSCCGCTRGSPVLAGPHADGGPGAPRRSHAGVESPRLLQRVAHLGAVGGGLALRSLLRAFPMGDVAHPAWRLTARERPARLWGTLAVGEGGGA